MATPTLCLRATPILLGLAACNNDLTVPADAKPADLLIVSGDRQQARAGQRPLDPLVVKVVDATERPVVGVPVRFEPASGASVDSAIATTNDSGQAATGVRLSNRTGEQEVDASVDGAAAPLQVTFHLIATAPRPASGSGNDSRGDDNSGEDGGREDGGREDGGGEDSASEDGGSEGGGSRAGEDDGDDDRPGDAQRDDDRGKDEGKSEGKDKAEGERGGQGEGQ